jgi:hypothetical protein
MRSTYTNLHINSIAGKLETKSSSIKRGEKDAYMADTY